MAPRKETTMARTKRTTRTTRKATRPAGKLGVLRANALKAVNELLLRGARLKARASAFGALTQLEKAFQSRVASVISKFGVPDA
ncbi:hypothetical protein, partial [Flavobacterium sp.]|uniref:hypothetical protein n=1 Tax=Flavobacterium sp. TaxID=239 RepID=UPI00374CBFE6